MIAMTRLLPAFLRDRRGSIAIETALVAPVLAVLALGSFEVGSLVSRQHELQTAAAEGEAGDDFRHPRNLAVAGRGPDHPHPPVPLQRGNHHAVGTKPM
ncbi:MAG: hypothetical protein B7X57_05165 [Erythrobacter sp. 34-65-8]|nr:MAG: hypothetical protein B7X57_05165 [Erythrobacter sp. 34-65-8]